MSKKISLSIKEPCHENWNAMTPTQKGSYCASCCKEVIDFTDMNDTQLAQFFKKPAGSVCGRFRSEQLEQEFIMPRKQLPWIRYFFQIALPAFLFSLKAGAQGSEAKGKIDTVASPKPVELRLGRIMVKPIDAPREIKGSVRDQQGNPIVGASIVVKGTHTGTVTDNNGNFLLQVKSRQPVVLVASSIGFQSLEITDSDTNILMLSMEASIMGELVVVRTAKKKKPVPLMQRLSDTVFTKFKIYPNPVQAGRKVVVEWKKGEKGNYLSTFTNLSGQVLLSKEVLVDSKIQLLSLDIPVTAPGIYVISFRNMVTGKLYTQQLQVQ
ncbi:MAG: hypothetical protein JWP88_1763 [Flaviaesturariibacter sp.]|nr:hypothetical protein [Flaviaesturariibacter sp.]